MSRHNSRSNEDIGWRFGIAIDGSPMQSDQRWYNTSQAAFSSLDGLEQHRFEHDQPVYRASRGTNYDEGGSSRPPSVPQMRRSATVQETSSRGSRDMACEQMSTPAARLRAVEVELEKDQTRTKQSKVNSSWLKVAKNKLIKAFGSWVIDTNVPFTVVDSVYTNPLIETIREVGPNVRASSSYELSDDISLIPNTCIDKVKIGKAESVDQQP
ncbi:hypothetical protein Cgig2_015755 [Carnegiea gigantea]|uniref:Uncharacterized protein n=1 Tax=Carnegiea gigantea TaxID=171969 RepID=A0A9Q1JH16_9CARY|nr:hypothetical protein Cgig2_015755 [Carnegiea gigantea]